LQKWENPRFRSKASALPPGGGLYGCLDFDAGFPEPSKMDGAGAAGLAEELGNAQARLCSAGQAV